MLTFAERYYYGNDVLFKNLKSYKFTHVKYLERFTYGKLL